MAIWPAQYLPLRRKALAFLGTPRHRALRGELAWEWPVPRVGRVVSVQIAVQSAHTPPPSCPRRPQGNGPRGANPRGAALQRIRELQRNRAVRNAFGEWWAAVPVS